MESDENKRIYAHMVAKAWADAAFKAKFLADPTQTARDSGMTLPPNTVVVVAHTGSAFTIDHSGAHPQLALLLPARPADLDEQVIYSHAIKGVPMSLA